MKKLSMTAAVCFSLLTAYPIYAQTETLEHECTSWIVFSDLTENNTNILHKKRDSKKRQIAVYLSPADSPPQMGWTGQPRQSYQYGDQHLRSCRGYEQRRKMYKSLHRQHCSKLDLYFLHTSGVAVTHFLIMFCVEHGI